MDIRSFIEDAWNAAAASARSASNLVGSAASAVGDGIGYARQSISSSWLFASTETSESAFDEKHYFLVPYRLAECGYTLYSMRCLPDGVPPINDLPKRRILHLPNAHARKMTEELLCRQAATDVQEDSSLHHSELGKRLIDLADGIDQLDKQAFNGALLIGGLVAIVNPVAGGLLAAKAMLPSIGFFLSRYGLQQVGETLNERTLKKKIAEAEKDVLQQFRGSETSEVFDPLLSQLDKALHTDAFEYDPLIDHENGVGMEPVTSDQRLTMTAIVNTYQSVIANKRQWVPAHLGTEDIRWLQLLEKLLAS